MSIFEEDNAYPYHQYTTHVPGGAVADHVVDQDTTTNGDIYHDALPLVAPQSELYKGTSTIVYDNTSSIAAEPECEQYSYAQEPYVEDTSVNFFYQASLPSKYEVTQWGSDLAGVGSKLDGVTVPTTEPSNGDANGMQWEGL